MVKKESLPIEIYTEKLSELMEAKDVSFMELSERTEIPYPTLKRIFNAGNDIKFSILLKIIAALNVSLDEYSYFLTDFSHVTSEILFNKLEAGYHSKDRALFLEVQEQAKMQGERMVELSAKALLGTLTESEEEEIAGELLANDLWTFYDYSILTNTCMQLPTKLIASIIHDFDRHIGTYEKRYKYRRIMKQITCRSAIAMIERGEQKEAFYALEYAKRLNYPRDFYMRTLYHFTEGLYKFTFGKGLDRREGVASMLRALDYQSWLGSTAIAAYYRAIFEANVSISEMADLEMELL